eukprot:GAHX01000910.1.p1 GENE.GAHX01000910.1~~GAHX01000910.1.p1  ORF type:complete len:226 (+),score=39.83 GAHX01000910.1:74-751(+)
MEDQLVSYFKDNLRTLINEHESVIKSNELSTIHLAFIIGPPACGKTTQGNLLSRTISNSRHVSCGQLLRNFCCLGTERSIQLTELLNNGIVVDGNITINLLFEEIFKTLKDEPECNKFIIDGFPRNIDNLKAFEDLNVFSNVVFIALQCNTENIRQRQSIRMSIDKRTDDTEKVLNKRISDFYSDTLETINLLKKKNKLIEINANKNKEDTHKDLLDEFKLCINL